MIDAVLTLETAHTHPEHSWRTLTPKHTRRHLGKHVTPKHPLSWHEHALTPQNAHTHKMHTHTCARVHMHTHTLSTRRSSPERAMKCLLPGRARKSPPSPPHTSQARSGSVLDWLHRDTHFHSCTSSQGWTISVSLTLIWVSLHECIFTPYTQVLMVPVSATIISRPSSQVESPHTHTPPLCTGAYISKSKEWRHMRTMEKTLWAPWAPHNGWFSWDQRHSLSLPIPFLGLFLSLSRSLSPSSFLLSIHPPHPLLLHPSLSPSQPLPTLSFLLSTSFSSPPPPSFSLFLLSLSLPPLSLLPPLTLSFNPPPPTLSFLLSLPPPTLCVSFHLSPSYYSPPPPPTLSLLPSLYLFLPSPSTLSLLPSFSFFLLSPSPIHSLSPLIFLSPPPSPPPPPHTLSPSFSTPHSISFLLNPPPPHTHTHYTLFPSCQPPSLSCISFWWWVSWTWGSFLLPSFSPPPTLSPSSPPPLPASLSQLRQFLMMGIMDLRTFPLSFSSPLPTPPCLSVDGGVTDTQVLFHSVDEILLFLNQAGAAQPKLVHFIPALSHSPRLHVKWSPETDVRERQVGIAIHTPACQMKVCWYSNAHTCTSNEALLVQQCTHLHLKWSSAGTAMHTPAPQMKLCWYSNEHTCTSNEALLVQQCTHLHLKWSSAGTAMNTPAPQMKLCWYSNEHTCTSNSWGKQ